MDGVELDGVLSDDHPGVIWVEHNDGDRTKRSRVFHGGDPGPNTRHLFDKYVYVRAENKFVKEGG